MFRKIFKKNKQKILNKIPRTKPTLYENLIYSGYKYSLTKAIDIALSIQKISFKDLDHDFIETVRIKSHLTFQSKYTDVYSVEGIKDGIIELIINNNGFAGIDGTMPDPYIENYVLYNRLSKQAILDFFDIFNNTIVTTRYFFDKRHVAECLSVRVEKSLIGKIFSSIAGFGFNSEFLTKETPLPEQFKIAAQNLFWRYSRSADMLKIMLSSFFNLDVEIEQFAGGFTAEAPQSELTRIGTMEKNYNSLGKNILLGSKVWDSGLGIIVNVKSLSLGVYLGFLPKASQKDASYSKLTKMKELIKMYIPGNIKAKIVFYLDTKNVHNSYLNGVGRLNKDFFIGGKTSRVESFFVEYV